MSTIVTSDFAGSLQEPYRGQPVPAPSGSGFCTSSENQPELPPPPSARDAKQTDSQAYSGPDLPHPPCQASRGPDLPHPTRQASRGPDLLHLILSITWYNSPGIRRQSGSPLEQTAILSRRRPGNEEKRPKGLTGILDRGNLGYLRDSQILPILIKLCNDKLLAGYPDR